MAHSNEILMPNWAYGIRGTAAPLDMCHILIVKPYPDPTAPLRYSTRIVSGMCLFSDDLNEGGNAYSEFSAVLERVWAETCLQWLLNPIDDPIVHLQQDITEGMTPIICPLTIGARVTITSDAGRLNDWWQDDFKKYGYITAGWFDADGNVVWDTPVKWLNFRDGSVRFGRTIEVMRIFLQPGLTAHVSTIRNLEPPRLSFSGWTSGVYPPLL